MSDQTGDVLPEPIGAIEEEDPAAMLARLAAEHGGQVNGLEDADADDRAMGELRQFPTPVVSPASTPAPLAPPKRASRTTRPATAQRTQRASATLATPQEARSPRLAADIPASVYEEAKKAAEAAPMSLTDYTLTALNANASALAKNFPKASDAVQGPIPLSPKARQRRNIGEPTRRLTLYLTLEQADAVDRMVEECNAGSRSALVTEALRSGL